MSHLSEQNQNIAKISSHEALMVVASHLLIFTNIAGVIINFVIFLTQGKESKFIRYHACEVLNLQISFIIYLTGLTILYLAALSAIIASGSFWGLLIMPISGILCFALFILIIVGAVKSSKGVYFKYPFIFRLVK